METEVAIPEPKRGGTFIYCPHATVAMVKVGRKKPTQVVTPCGWRTLKIRKYRRHWRKKHGGEQ